MKTNVKVKIDGHNYSYTVTEGYIRKLVAYESPEALKRFREPPYILTAIKRLHELKTVS